METSSLLCAHFCIFFCLHCWSRRQQCSRLLTGLLNALKEASGPQDRWVEDQVEAFRVQAAQVVMEAASVLFAVVQLMCYLGLTGASEDLVKTTTFGFSVLYPLCLAGRHDGLLRITRRRARVMYVAVHAFMMIAEQSVGANNTVQTFGGVRTLFRVGTAFMVLDLRLTTAVNLAWSAQNILQQFRLAPSGGHADSVFSEVLSLMGMEVLLVFAEALLRSHFRLSSSAAATSRLQQAVRGLLSVLCDAELQLSEELIILEPGAKVAQLLGAELAGRSFTDFIGAADLERFLLFLRDASASAAPASMQLQLCDAAGHAFAAELFLARLPGAAGERGHLMGIKDCGPAREAAQPMGPTFGPGPLQAEDSSPEVLSEVFCASEMHDLSLELLFDPLEEGAPLQELRCSYSGMPPRPLGSCFHGACRKRLLAWQRQSCRAFLEDEDCDLFQGAAVQLPSLMLASSAAISFRDGPGDQIMGSIQLQGLRQLHLPWDVKSQGSGKSQRSAQSQRSARSLRSKSTKGGLQHILEAEDSA